jgi:hypothetical protein
VATTKISRRDLLKKAGVAGSAAAADPDACAAPRFSERPKPVAHPRTLRRRLGVDGKTASRQFRG